METCKACGQSVEDLDASQVGSLISNARVFTTGFGYGLGNWHARGAGFKADVEGLGEVEVVYSGFNQNGDYDETILMVFKTRVGLVRITGSYDSYSDMDWNYDWKFTEGEVKEIVVYK